MTTSVKDTVHGYIELDDFEKKVIDSPWFQRLRRVRQNDVCSFVYPTMLTTRFEHSLGAMHIAGECLKAALEDRASIGSVRAFLQQLGAELSSVVDVKQSPEGLALFAQRATRMYGALHDIGHPPYSHLLESCYTPSDIGVPGGIKDSWHETNGAEIAGDHHAASLVPLGEKGEQHLHLVAALLDVAEIVERDRVVAVEDRELVFEAQIALGGKQSLDEIVELHSLAFERVAGVRRLPA